MQKSKRILVIRFSAIGDVAMVLPLLYSMAEAYPEHQFTFLSQAFLEKLLINKPNNLHFYPVYLKEGERTIGGIIRLFRRLYGEGFDTVVDLHDVLRTKVLRTLFRLCGMKVRGIDKGRSEKKALTRKEAKAFRPLTTTVERYRQALESAGFIFPLTFRSLFEHNVPELGEVTKLFGSKCGSWIGVAPFAKHRGKIYPIEKCTELIQELSHPSNRRIFLFGGGAEELIQLNQLASGFENVVVAGGRFGLADELALMSQLDAMVSMDSANMHFASLVGIPVVSVWGATHPYAGFMGYRQSEEWAVQLDLPCRPCSVFGDKPCYRGDFACMEQLNPGQIVRTLEQLVGIKGK